MDNLSHRESRRTASQQYKNEELHIPMDTLDPQGASHHTSTMSSGPVYGSLESRSLADGSGLGRNTSNLSHNSVYSASAGGGATSALPGSLQPGRQPNEAAYKPANVTNPPAAAAATTAAPPPPPPPFQTGGVATSAAGEMQPSLQHASHPQQPSTAAPLGSLNPYQSSARPTSTYQQPTSSSPDKADVSMISTASSSGYVPAQPQRSRGSSQQSPLGLADIRQEVPYGEEPANKDGAGLPSTTNSTYVSPYPLYALDWCKWPIQPGTFGKVATGSYLEDNHNYLQIFDTQEATCDLDQPESQRGLEFVKIAEATHSYPVTRVLWEPPSGTKQSTDLLASSGDHLRLWSLPAECKTTYGNSIHQKNLQRPVAKLSPLALLSNSKSSEHTAPITSLDWNAVSPSLIITSSIDTTCTIWNIPTLTAKTQLIAHDKEVYDVRFCANSLDAFVSCGADGSVRMFDLRSLEHSTIIYEPNEKTDRLASPGDLTPPSGTALWPPPLHRIATSPHDAYLLATFSQDSSIIRILDTRQPGQALYELKGHCAPVNSIEWSPSRRGLLASGADDCLVCIWDITNQQASSTVQPTQHEGHGGPSSITSERGPAAAWRSDYEVSNISWSPHIPSQGSRSGRGWVGVASGRVLSGVAI